MRESKKRKTLRYLFAVFAGSGIVAASIPFIKYFGIPKDRVNPTTDIDISGLKEGVLKVAHWNNMPIYITRRPDTVLKELNKNNEGLLDASSLGSIQPQWAKNNYSSIRPDIFVAVGICTHGHCSPTFRPENAPIDLGSDWKGGFFCPCHGSKYDHSGRVYKGGPAPRNLAIPEYEFLKKDVIRIKNV